MKTLLFLILVATCVGCATPYQSRGIKGGYSETQLDENTFRVCFSGNGYTSSERAEDFVLLRSAQLAIKHGYRYFAIVGQRDTSKVETITTPSTSHTSGSANYVGSRFDYTEDTCYTPGQTVHIHKPRSVLLIRCYEEKPSNARAFDASFLIGSIAPKYKLKLDASLNSFLNGQPNVKPKESYD